MSSEEACVVHGSQDQVVDLQNATTQINPRHQISIIHLFDRFYESLLPISSNTKLLRMAQKTDHCNKYRQHYALYSQFAGMWNGEQKTKGSMLIRLVSSP
jgi:hypothetical protein